MHEYPIRSSAAGSTATGTIEAKEKLLKGYDELKKETKEELLRELLKE